MNNCKGCLTYIEVYEIGCAFTMGGTPKIKSGITCPCTKCLVKVMCSEVCDIFNLYISLFTPSEVRLKNIHHQRLLDYE